MKGLSTTSFGSPSIGPEGPEGLQAGRRVLLATHGLTDKEVSALNIPTGIPLMYHLDQSLRPIDHDYLGDPEAVAAAIGSIAAHADADASPSSRN